MSYRICFAFIPSEEMRGLHPFLACTNGVLSYLMLYCGSLWTFYFFTVLMYFEMIFSHYIAYNRDLGVSEFVMCTIFAFSSMVIMLAISAGIEFISSL